MPSSSLRYGRRSVEAQCCYIDGDHVFATGRHIITIFVIGQAYWVLSKHNNYGDIPCILAEFCFISASRTRADWQGAGLKLTLP